MQHIGAYLRKNRQSTKKKVTQREAAANLGVQTNAYANIELNKIDPPFSRVVRSLQFFMEKGAPRLDVDLYKLSVYESKEDLEE